MDTAGAQNNSLTPSQQKAVAARGNVLVMAGAGTGKTHTLVERCLDIVCNERASLDELLIVTFTEAAATEVRERLREGLADAAVKRPTDSHLPEQLAMFDAAHIGTLHSFCYKLVRGHFHALGLDPQLTVLDEAQARLLADEILEAQFESHYENEDEFSIAVQDLITVYGNGRDESIRALVSRLHHYIQTRADADAWLARQIDGFSSAEPLQWREWLQKAVQEWRDEWIPVLRNLGAQNAKAAECLELLEPISPGAVASLDSWGPLFRQLGAADQTENYPSRKKIILRKPLEGFFDDAEFLRSLFPNAENPANPNPATGKSPSTEPLREDWDWCRAHMKTLLLLAKEFSEQFASRKRTDGVADFHDLEQFAIKLLWKTHVPETPGVRAVPAEVALEWRNKLKFIFVDEYQDINDAQDKIISALGADNRFLVGDIKQSIYRFRLADPGIFRNYAKNPGEWNARVISLTENFRSREALLAFVNSIFVPLMTENLGGVLYDDTAKLKFGAPAKRSELSISQNSGPRVEMLLREKKRNESAESAAGDEMLEDLQESELEARMIALRLREMKDSGHRIWDDSLPASTETGKFRAARWSDFAVLLRSPGAKAEVYAKQFERAGVPLLVVRGGFYDSSEISDLLSLLQLADNPLQDVPCIAVLRSPLVGCSPDELAEIRMTAHGHFWFALNRAAAPDSTLPEPTRLRLDAFLRQFSKWRTLARRASISECLDAILADTHYDDWLLSRPRGAHRRANVRRFLHLAEQFDSFQRQGLFRFLKFVDAQREIEAEPDVAPLAEEDAVRLMSIHQSKGLEFPVVALADLGKTFNEQDLRGEIILDEQYGLCPKIKPPSSGGRYPSLSYWLARKNQRRELRSEELRLLYVAFTRARDTLILSGSASAKKWEAWAASNGALAPRDLILANSCMDWLGMWSALQHLNVTVQSGEQGESPLLKWRVVDDSELSGQAPGSSSPQSNAVPHGLSLDGLPGDRLNEILSWKYPFEAATLRAAKTSATALRREAEDEEAEQLFHRVRAATSPSVRRRVAARLSAADAGLAHHKFLQHFAFESAKDLKSFVAEAKRLETENYLSADETRALDLEGLADFWNSEMGRRVRANAAGVRRELAFTAGFAPDELDAIFGRETGMGLDNEMIVVQGVADLAVLLPKEIWLLDFKTDDVSARDLPEKIAYYSPQLKLYARALEKIYSVPVTDCRLHFLAARKTVAIKN
ncbi:MAG TPA: UvrD-helicase domain-containing protein [Verrucomicrobiae bacterium]|nr:UvrD-helicase domain-containing protein [Verrucomicrobiae bacterium]